MFGPEDVYKSIENDKLGHKLYLSSTYEVTEKWTKESLEFKVLMTLLTCGRINEDDIFERLKVLAAEEIDEQYANENDIPIYVYLTALDDLNEPYTEPSQEKYMQGCEIVSKVKNLHWARKHILAWANFVQLEDDKPID